jgi:glutathione synthase
MSKNIKVGFQTDAIENLNFKTDSSLPLMYESQKRKYTNYFFLPDSLTYKNRSVYARAQQIKFKKNNFNDYVLSKVQEIRLNSLDYIFVRQDPPFDMKYISSMHLLEQIKGNTTIVNSPVGIRNAPEKISMLAHQKIIPPTIVTRLKIEVDRFLDKHDKAVIKPLYGNGGEGIFLLSKKDKNYNQIIEQFITQRSEPFVIQKFLPEISRGDKRIIIIDGKPIAALKRIPKSNEIRSNIHVGGSGKAVKITERDRFICNEIKGFLKDQGLFFVGIDVIGNYLTEINVTSPTCIQEIKRLHKIDIAEEIWKKLRAL